MNLLPELETGVQSLKLFNDPAPECLPILVGGPLAKARRRRDEPPSKRKRSMEKFAVENAASERRAARTVNGDRRMR
jgi:hypothetical protein